MTNKPTDKEEIGLFVFRIHMFRHKSGRFEWRTESANSGVPTEIVLMQMKGWLKRSIATFFDNLNSNTTEIQNKGESK